MTYSDITFKDRNPVKRWLQRSRLLTAATLASKMAPPSTICDFGAGNGELCKFLAATYRHARIICYEPSPRMLAEARLNLDRVENVEFCSDIAAIPRNSIDLLFCLEVLEHLPPRQTSDAIAQFRAVLNERGSGIIGVPVEIGLPAFYKGLFRMTRRFGEFDARLHNVLRSVFGTPPADRPVAEIAPGVEYHFHHIGFDYRNLRQLIAARFHLRETAASPFGALGPFINPEVYLVFDKEVGKGRYLG